MSQENNPEWPPRSPHHVLLSTPSGRDRLRRLAERASPSPSPTKRLRSGQKGVIAEGRDIHDSEEDDEETLQLKLEEIQARLKLKKMQKKSKQIYDTEKVEERASSFHPLPSTSPIKNAAKSKPTTINEERSARSISQTTVNVPISPIRRVKPGEAQRSPGRVLLGIDKGLRGKDISLKRAPSLRRPEERDQRSRLAGPFLQRASSQSGDRTPAASADLQPIGNKQKSFSERLADIRTQDTDREERQLRIQKHRSTAFDIDHAQMESYKKTATILPETLRPAPEFSREEILSACGKPSSGLTRNKTATNFRASTDNTRPSTETLIPSIRPETSASDDQPGRTTKSARLEPLAKESDTSQFEPYSSTHLSKRIIPHNELTRILAGKKTFTIPALLRVVKAPDFATPDIEEDLVLFGIVVQKSEPRAHQQQPNKENRGKYMVMTLADLKWEIDLYLFDTAFDKFWKLTVGTVIAILNPGIMPPQRNKIDTGRFSLTLNSNADTVLEIGSVRDLGFCKSVKKDGKTCDSWVNKRHTEFCDFHVNETLKKTHANRMEVNTMTFGKGTYSSKNARSKINPSASERLKKLTRYDLESHSQIYMSRGSGPSATKLLDDVDFDPDAFHRGSTKEERLMRRLLAKEKESELGRKLAEMGGGLGADYMRRREHASQTISAATSNITSSAAEPPPTISTLGLLTTKAVDVALSPVKRKRANTVSSTGAVGWGGNLSKELARMKNGETLRPVKKKTRFVTEKGIREAGRESLGGDAVRNAGNGIDDAGEDGDDDDDDDDGLDIVKD